MTETRQINVRYFKIGDVAEQLNVSVRTVHRWIADRQLVVHRVGQRAVRVSQADLKAFLAIRRDAN